MWAVVRAELCQVGLGPLGALRDDGDAGIMADPDADTQGRLFCLDQSSFMFSFRESDPETSCSASSSVTSSPFLKQVAFFGASCSWEGAALQHPALCQEGTVFLT